MLCKYNLLLCYIPAHNSTPEFFHSAPAPPPPPESKIPYFQVYWEFRCKVQGLSKFCPNLSIAFCPNYGEKAMEHSGKKQWQIWAKAMRISGKSNGKIWAKSKQRYTCTFRVKIIAFARISHYFSPNFPLLLPDFFFPFPPISHCFCANFSFLIFVFGGHSAPLPPPPPSTPMTILFHCLKPP